MAAIAYHIVVAEPENLVMPFEELLLALGRTPFDPHSCHACRKTILFGAYCMACEPNLGRPV